MAVAGTLADNIVAVDAGLTQDGHQCASWKILFVKRDDDASHGRGVVVDVVTAFDTIKHEAVFLQ